MVFYDSFGLSAAVNSFEHVKLWARPTYSTRLPSLKGSDKVTLYLLKDLNN